MTNSFHLPKGCAVVLAVTEHMILIDQPLPKVFPDTFDYCITQDAYHYNVFREVVAPTLLRVKALGLNDKLLAKGTLISDHIRPGALLYADADAEAGKLICRYLEEKLNGKLKKLFDHYKITDYELPRNPKRVSHALTFAAL